jgi:hypothetical protein
MAKQVLAAFLIVALAVGSIGPFERAEAAQERVVRVDGVVQWIGGLRMVLQSDTGPSVGVDLVSVPQTQYAGLVARDRVAVIGTLSPDNRDIIGTSVVRSERTR